MVTEGNSGFAEQAVADYLGEHPEFFNRRPDLLLALALGHSPGERNPRNGSRDASENARSRTTRKHFATFLCCRGFGTAGPSRLLKNPIRT